MKILFSIAPDQTFAVPRGAWNGHQIDAWVMPSDYGLRGARKRLFHVVCVWQIARRAAPLSGVGALHRWYRSVFSGASATRFVSYKRAGCAPIFSSRARAYPTPY